MDKYQFQIQKIQEYSCNEELLKFYAMYYSMKYIDFDLFRMLN